MGKYSYSIYNSTSVLPDEWDSIAHENIFLSRNGLAVLKKAPPANMECHFVGLFSNGKLCGIALIQYLDLARVATFKNRERSFCLKDYLIRKFSSHVLFIGNNTLTGQNAYLLNKEISETEALALLQMAMLNLKKEYSKKGKRIHLLAVKDFNEKEMPDFEAAGYNGYYKFCTQPNMIFTIRPGWQSVEDYLSELNTKYRTQHNRARKKAAGITKKKLSLSEISALNARIHELYLTVADKAAFNTFYLPQHHFEIMKQELKDKFRFYGYFEGEKLVGFNTLIKNGHDADTYFLGYDEEIQKEKMLYLNMLYDMVAYAIKKEFKHIIFARSAMEIKSSVGATAEEVFGIIKHTNPLLNFFMQKLFTYFDPKVEWKARNPFKT
ncbi:GNAT family N-acetyltransferase [Flavobacterium sp.]|uniref:GNAT family N-acetyltransferase n=1 Tax=Flavobacterium sp. TaxID=239 RepID=UPI002628DDDE|nr:GNAT family N-acetyltransferase [Flavobacterium sp.]